MVVHKRSGKRHLVHPDQIATRCGRVIRRPNWRPVEEEGPCDCRSCIESLLAWAEGRERCRI